MSSSRSNHSIALGQVLAQRRDWAGLSQDDVARAAGMSMNHYGRVERGESGVTVALLIAIARALHTTAAELLAEAKL
ncbi:MAG: helix-turn-helix transcriptional regulator [Solirubrobacterales bacterium]|nr:helix-turn-helix transcriptional regulator [Solirubrobacterales bacterium]